MRGRLEQLRNWSENDRILAAVLTGPTVIWIVGIIAYPVYLIFRMTVYDRRTVEGDAPFVGLDNFVYILRSSDFWHSTQLTLIWTVGNIVLIVVLGVLIALVLNAQYPGRRTLQNWALLPWLFPIVVSILMWRWLLDPNSGVISYVAMRIGLVDSPISFFRTSTRAMATVIFVNVWRWAPFMAIVTLAALQTVPEDLRDQAIVDGASRPQLFRHVTLPHIRPTVTSTGFIILIWLANMFPPIWLMTEGGPGDATTTLPILIYQRGLRAFRMSESATMSVLLLLGIVVPIGIAYFKTFGREQISQSD